MGFEFAPFSVSRVFLRTLANAAFLSPRGWGALAFTALAVSGCQTTGLSMPNLPALPSFAGGANAGASGGKAYPLPVYLPGDRFSYDNGRTVRVVSVDGDWVTWAQGNAYQWTANRDFTMPPKGWNTSTRTSQLTKLTITPGAMWPLRKGNSEDFIYANLVHWKDGSQADRTYSQRRGCWVEGSQTITVPAGVFNTVKTSCYRYRAVNNYFYGKRTWYYAPRIGQVVLTVDENTTRVSTRVALVSYRKTRVHLNRSEAAFANGVLQTALQTKLSGKTLVQSRGRVMVSVTPLRTYRTTKGLFCRDYRRLTSKGERTRSGTGTACHVANGTWKRL